LKRTEKAELVTAMSEVFSSAQVGLLVDYRGLNVGDITDLRRRLHDSNARMKVLKNRIAKIAVKDTPFAELEREFTEPRALIYGEDPVSSAKVVSDYLKDNDKLKYISGMLVTGAEGSALDANRLKALGNLPSREELLVKLLFLMNAVPTSFVRTLNEVPAKFVRLLAQVAEKKQAQG